MTMKGKKVTVVGLARSGVAAANLLASLGAKVFATDSKGPDALTASIGKLEKTVALSLGGHPDKIFLEADFIVVSPGVPMHIKPLTMAREKGIPIISELELAYLLTDVPFMSITGTNGKSTTTTLIDLMMKKAGFKTILGGNIGKALTEEIQKMVSSQKPIDYIVAEVSSFQLEAIDTFKTKVAVILNITPDHLDRYKNINEYVDAKARIFENQRENDCLILNADDPGCMKLYDSKLRSKDTASPNTFFFSRKDKVDGIYLKDGIIFLNFPKIPPNPPLVKGGEGGFAPDLSLIHADKIKIQGVHNIENAMAASLAAFLAGSNVEAIREALMEFGGLEHRLEFVEEIKGVSFINDSKGTNVGAVIKSLESFKSPVILIAGGLDKASDFNILRDPVRERVKHLILIGEAKDKIAKSLMDVTEISYAITMDEAVKMANLKAIPGDTVLLSPACASFDMFLDFEDRGRKFKEVVRRIRDA